MRIMRYRIELNADEGYLICNATTTWNRMPKASNLEHPSIRIKGDVDLLAKYVETGNDESDDLNPESQDFCTNYLQILHGERPDWVLAVIKIGKTGITLAFFNRTSGYEKDLYVAWSPYLNVTFEVDREDGGVDTYQLAMSADETDINRLRRLTIMECDTHGDREVCFTPRYLTEASGPDNSWDYAYITEFR